MSDRKVQKWFKAILMLLPFVFLLIFAISLINGELKYEVLSDEPESYKLVDVIYYDSEEEIYQVAKDGELVDNEENGYICQIKFDNSLLYFMQFQDTMIARLKYTTYTKGEEIFYCPIYYNYNNGEIELRPINSDMTLEIQGICLGIDEICIESYESVLNDIGVYSYIAFYVEQDEQFSYLKDACIVSSNNSRIIKEYIQEPNDVITYTGIDAVAMQFNDFTDKHLKLNIFGIDEFYDWSVDNWFHGTAPLIYKPIFILLVYEFVIELLFLMFDFISFLIRFARKWVNGLYDKGGA